MDVAEYNLSSSAVAYGLPMRASRTDVAGNDARLAVASSMRSDMLMPPH